MVRHKIINHMEQRENVALIRTCKCRVLFIKRMSHKHVFISLKLVRGSWNRVRSHRATIFHKVKVFFFLFLEIKIQLSVYVTYNSKSKTFIFMLDWPCDKLKQLNFNIYVLRILYEF